MTVNSRKQEAFPVAPVVTIDGPGGSGKGTVSKLLAAKLQWHLLDSGALYRVVAVAANHHGVALDDATALEALAEHLDVQFRVEAESEGVAVIFEGENVTDEVRSESTGQQASIVAAIPEVRTALLERQREFAEAPGLIADGRDMGTVVFPQAPVKIYLTASAEERANRRYKQLINKGVGASLQTVLREIQDRDARDSGRDVAPLKPAEDALLLDSTALSIDEVLARVLDEIKAKGLI